MSISSNGWKRVDRLITPTGVRFEHRLEPCLELHDRLLAEIPYGGGLEPGDQVLDVLEIEPAFGRRVEIPGSRHEPADDVVLEPRYVAARCTQMRHDLWDGQALGGARYIGQRRDEQEPGDITGIAGGLVGVHDLGDGLAVRGDVMGDGRFQGRVDLVDLARYLAIVQIDVVGRDEIARVRMVPPEPGGDDAHEPDETTGLLEAGVFLEAGVEVPDGRMKRVGLGDAVGKLLRGGIADIHLASIAHGPGIRLRDLVDVLPGRPFIENAGAQDVVELVRVHAHGFQVHRQPAGLAFQIGQGLVDPLCTGLVGGGEIGDHETNVLKPRLAQGDEQVGERRPGDRGKVGVTDGLGPGVLEVGRQLVQQDEEGLALEKVDPRRLARRR